MAKGLFSDTSNDDKVLQAIIEMASKPDGGINALAMMIGHMLSGGKGGGEKGFMAEKAATDEFIKQFGNPGDSPEVAEQYSQHMRAYGFEDLANRFDKSRYENYLSGKKEKDLKNFTDADKDIITGMYMSMMDNLGIDVKRPELEKGKTEYANDYYQTLYQAKNIMSQGGDLGAFFESKRNSYLERMGQGSQQTPASSSPYGSREEWLRAKGQ